jgi:hypothetical protein
LRSIPSSITTARRTSASGRLTRSISRSRVRETNARLTADIDVDLEIASISEPTGSRVPAKRHVETPASIRSRTNSVSRSHAA